MKNKVLGGIVTLVHEGRTDRIPRPHDHNCYCDVVPAGFFEACGKTYVLKSLGSALHPRGISKVQTDAMLVGNPRRVLEAAALGRY